jgi:hypothetical protein
MEPQKLAPALPDGMSALERIREMLHLASTANRLFPATIFYNEGWLLRLVLDWFSRQGTCNHALGFRVGARWFSEALLPSQFFARKRGDRLAEGWTHADGVIGHVTIGDAALADTTLIAGGAQFVVTEAKLFSPLAQRVTNAAFFDQAARNVACIAEVLSRADRRPEGLSVIGFFVIAPQEQIARNLFQRELSLESIQEKVSRRVSEYELPERQEKEAWLHDWFLPTLKHTNIASLSWEQIVGHINSTDAQFGRELGDFYDHCIKFNRIQERD